MAALVARHKKKGPHQAGLSNFRTTTELPTTRGELPRGLCLPLPAPATDDPLLSPAAHQTLKDTNHVKFPPLPGISSTFWNRPYQVTCLLY
jgi:hypothetical protein